MMKAAKATFRIFFGLHYGTEHEHYIMVTSNVSISKNANNFRITGRPSSATRFLGVSSSFWRWFETEGFVVCLLAAIGVISFLFLYRGVAIWKAALVLVVFSITCTWLGTDYRRIPDIFHNLTIFIELSIFHTIS